MEQYLNPESIYTLPIGDEKVVKVILEGPFTTIDFIPSIDEICAIIRTNDLEVLKHFISIRIK